MDNMKKLVGERRSVRTFDGRELTAADKEKLALIWKPLITLTDCLSSSSYSQK